MRKTILISELAGLVGTIVAADIETQLENGETVVTVVIDDALEAWPLKEEFDLVLTPPTIPEFKEREFFLDKKIAWTHPTNAARKR